MMEFYDDGYDPEPWGDQDCDHCTNGGAKEVNDPFALEIDLEEVKMTLCRSCWEQRRDDI